MDEKFIILGIGLILAGFCILFIGSLMSMSNNNEGNNAGKDDVNFKGGGVIMLGPIPIGFGSDKGMMIISIILSIVLMAVAFLFFKFFRF